MTISDRYREISRDVEQFLKNLQAGDVEQAPMKEVVKADAGLKEEIDLVGDIPRMHLEMKLTPVLLKAHNQLDRSRLLFEEAGEEALAASAWGLQQKIYRLLNDL